MATTSPPFPYYPNTVNPIHATAFRRPSKPFLLSPPQYPMDLAAISRRTRPYNFCAPSQKSYWKKGEPQAEKQSVHMREV